jgi:DNA invertase Pin-like site-specific DNA recombinase
MAASQGDVTDKDLRDAVRELTPSGTQEVADRVGLSRQAVDRRLRQVEDRHGTPLVWSKKIGPTKVWLHADHVAPR